MILRAIEDKRFRPVNSDRERASDFGLIAGTHRDFGRAVGGGRPPGPLAGRGRLGDRTSKARETPKWPITSGARSRL